MCYISETTKVDQLETTPIGFGMPQNLNVPNSRPFRSLLQLKQKFSFCTSPNFALLTEQNFE